MKTILQCLVVTTLFIVSACSQIKQENIDTSKPSPNANQAMPTDIIPTPYEVLPLEGDNSSPNPPLPTTYLPAIQNLVDKAIIDLAVRLTVVQNQINVLSVTPVTWPDASLGCQQPSMSAAQVLTDGYIIKLSFNQNDFEYHTNSTDFVIYCKNPSILPIISTPSK